jgi:hypothetical protein
MDYAPNPTAHLLPPIERTRYLAPSIARQPLDDSLPLYSALPSHRTAPPHDAAPPPHGYPSNVISAYGAPTPAENPPPPHLPHYVAPEAYYRDKNVVQQYTPSQSHVFRSSYYTNPTSHYSRGYDPFPDMYAPRPAQPDSVYSVIRYSYQRTACQSKQYDKYGYPQVRHKLVTLSFGNSVGFLV